MNLNTSDLANLYGSSLFVIPKQVAPLTTPKPTDATPESHTLSLPFTIKSVVGASLAIVLSETEVGDAALNSLLLNILQAIGKAREEVTEVVIHNAITEKQLSELSAHHILIFGENTIPLPSNPFKLSSGSTVFIVPTLKQMHTDIGQKRIGWETIKQFKDKL